MGDCYGPNYIDKRAYHSHLKFRGFCDLWLSMSCHLGLSYLDSPAGTDKVAWQLRAWYTACVSVGHLMDVEIFGILTLHCYYTDYVLNRSDTKSYRNDVEPWRTSSLWPSHITWHNHILDDTATLPHYTTQPHYMTSHHSQCHRCQTTPWQRVWKCARYLQRG